MASPGQKVVLITGCSSGIGLRMAVMLAKDEQKRYHGECVCVCALMREGEKVYLNAFFSLLSMTCNRLH